MDAKGNLWVTDTGNNRVQEFSSTGTYLSQFGTAGTGNGQFKEPRGVVVDSEEHVWVADTGNNRVQEFSSTGTYLSQFGTAGAGNGQFKDPYGIALDSKGNLWVADTFNSRVQEFSSTGTYLSQFGTAGAGNGHFELPFGLAVNSKGNLWVADTFNSRVQELSSTGEYLGKLWTPTAFKEPVGVAVSGEKMWVTNTGANRFEQFSTAGTYAAGFGSEGTGNGQFKTPRGIAVDAKGNVWVVDSGNNRVQEFSSTGEYVRQFGSEGVGNGQFKKPSGIVVDSKEDVWVVDSGNNRVQEFSSTGEYVRQFGVEGLSVIGSSGIAVDSAGHVWVAIFFGVKEFSSTGEYIKEIETFTSGVLALYVTVDAKGNMWVIGEGKVSEFSSTGEYIRQFGSKGTGNGQLKNPTGLALDSAGNVWVADTANNRIQTFVETPAGFHASQTVYYTVASNYAYPGCGKHPEWANLPCQSQPAAQPGTSGLPELPVVTDTYNMWDEPETVTEKFGSITRTKKMTYDDAGRPLTNEETSTIDTSLPKVTDEYSSETGALEKQNTTTGSETKTITRTINTLGQLTEYTDADSNTTKYVYSGPVNDGKIEEVNYGGKKGSQMYSYDPTTKALTKLLDVGPEGGAGAGTFTASYDVEGKMTSETYPNGMTAKYTHNSTGEATEIAYEKTTHCTEKCTWFGETVVPSIHGEALIRTSTLAKEEYTNDNAGRLTQVQETPVGKGCKTRIYAYNEDSNRTSLTTREPGTEGKCATTGGTTENHEYDEADRLTDTNVSYETFGNQTKIPATDAEGHEITATFYVDNQTHTQTQNSETLTYNTDPEGRNREIESTGTTNSKVINHYPGPGEAISWTSEGSEKWTRNIPGIDGTLTAMQHNSEAAVLQLHDLQGNIVATAALSETEIKLLTTYNSTEYGVPTNGTPPKYSWLGAIGLATELPSGTTASGGSSYVPQLGRPLQTQPVVPPGAPTMMYITPYVSTLTPGMYEAASAYAAGALGREATRQREAKEQWEREHPATPPGAIPTPGEGGAGPLGGSEGWSCEYAAETGQEGGCEDPEHSQYLTRGEAEETAFAFRVGGAAAKEEAEEILGPIGGLIVSLGAAYIDGVAHNLELCANLIGPPISGAARCKLTLYTWRTPIIHVQIPYKLGVETCIPYGKKLKCT